MQPIDWDDAFDARKRIEDVDSIFERNAEAAERFRAEQLRGGHALLGLPYGAHVRERVDLFRPAQPKGLIVYVHGGYWHMFDRTDWSPLAGGALARGWAVALPGYTLCPEGSVPHIVRQVARAVEHVAGLVPGPIRLVGHSAGGQVATRLVAERSPLVPAVLERIEAAISISGVHDLAPLLLTTMNETLRLDETTALAESPARLEPAGERPVTAWVGGDERPEFLRQAALLAERWGAELVIQPDRHHFDVLDPLEKGGPLLDRVAG